MGVANTGTPVLWIGFTLFVLTMLALDLGVFHRQAREIRLREALLGTALWISLALVFNIGVYHWFGRERALEFLTGYVIEEALSVDNIFVFLVIFSYFKVPSQVQHRVLFWGIIGAFCMRLLFIFLGAALIERFHWLIFVFGAFLVFTGAKLLRQSEGNVHPERNPLLRLCRRYFRTVSDYRGSRFFVVEGGKRFATPLFLVLVVIEATDIVFAVDSIPAIFAITTDPFIVFTSNIFAIMGLRALYFALAGAMGKFHYLSVGLAMVLMFVGVKMMLSDFYHIPIGASLGVVVSLLGGAVAISLLRPQTRAAGRSADPPK